SVQDIITGGAGIDTIIFNNEDLVGNSGLVTASELAQTTSIEVYDLRGNSITLELTDNMIETAQDQDLTVRTDFGTTLPGIVVEEVVANDWVQVGDDPLLFGAGGPYTV